MNMLTLIALLALSTQLPDPVCNSGSNACQVMNGVLYGLHALDGFVARFSDLMRVMNMSACTNITTIDPWAIVWEYYYFQWTWTSNWALSLARYLILIRDTL